MHETSPTASGHEYVLYSDDVEEIGTDEHDVIARIIKAMGAGGELTREKHGKSVRTSHAKAHGLIRGELIVPEGLPDYLRQGLFTTPRTYDVIARLSQVPGDLDDDRQVSTPRGFSLKVFGAEGEMLPVHAGEVTQDFVLDTGKVFNAIGAKTFLMQIEGVERTAPRLPQTVKGAVSAVARHTNEALHTVGTDSAALDFFGHPFLHPLGEDYYSQVPFRYGNYIAKMRVAPADEGLRRFAGQTIKPGDYNGLRTEVTEYFRHHSAEFLVSIQLCTDLQRMPVENANVEWPEDESPYQTVGRLVFPPQEAYSPARKDSVEGQLSFCPAHSLAAHRPLGSIMRARMFAYEALGRARREQNGYPVKEPRGVNEIPN